MSWNNWQEMSNKPCSLWHWTIKWLWCLLCGNIQYIKCVLSESIINLLSSLLGFTGFQRLIEADPVSFVVRCLPWWWPLSSAPVSLLFIIVCLISLTQSCSVMTPLELQTDLKTQPRLSCYLSENTFILFEACLISSL